jgi:arylsulfatase A-like enzyme
VREGDWKLITFTEKTAGPELYDLANDPHEGQNLASRESARARHLRKVLDKWWGAKHTP